MRRSSRFALIALAGLSSVLVVAAAEGESARSHSGAVVKTAFNKTLKKAIIVDGAGHTLYMFTSDVGGKPGTCAALGTACTKLWPAYTSVGAPAAGPGIKASLLGTATGPGGKQQVVYNHHPLYHFAGGQGYGPGDKKPGDIGGQGIYKIWYVLSAKGTPIK